jgi:hypothetical protein
MRRQDAKMLREHTVCKLRVFKTLRRRLSFGEHGKNQMDLYFLDSKPAALTQRHKDTKTQMPITIGNKCRYQLAAKGTCWSQTVCF